MGGDFFGRFWRLVTSGSLRSPLVSQRSSKGHPKVSQRYPEGPPGSPKGRQRSPKGHPKVTQRSSKVTQRSPKVSQGLPKVSPRSPKSPKSCFLAPRTSKIRSQGSGGKTQDGKAYSDFRLFMLGASPLRALWGENMFRFWTFKR